MATGPNDKDPLFSSVFGAQREASSRAVSSSAQRDGVSSVFVAGACVGGAAVAIGAATMLFWILDGITTPGLAFPLAAAIVLGHWASVACVLPFTARSRWLGFLAAVFVVPIGGTAVLFVWYYTLTAAPLLVAAALMSTLALLFVLNFETEGLSATPGPTRRRRPRASVLHIFSVFVLLVSLFWWCAVALDVSGFTNAPSPFPTPTGASNA